MNDPIDKVTRILNAAASGDQQAAAELLPLVYEELRKLAHARMARLPPGQTLQPTALVHEVYLRIAHGKNQEWEGRTQFFYSAAQAMRDLLVENARRRTSLKRGGDRKRVPLQDSDLVIEMDSDGVLAVEEALQKLEESDPEKARLVTLRYYGGLSNQESADVLGMSLATFERRWRFVRSWLERELSTSRPGIDPEPPQDD